MGYIIGDVPMANWELMRLWNSLTYSVLLECVRQTIDSRQVQFAV